jgi:K319L-like, PKD domain
MSIPFAIKNTKVVGTLLLILPTISFGVSVNTNGIELNSEGISQIVGFILFLIAGIMALLHKDDDNKKKRKAFAIILDFLDKVNSAKEWNDRLHELNRKLGPYEDILPDYIRHAIDSVATNTDLDELRRKISEELSNLSWKPVSRITKMIAVMVLVLLPLGFGVYAYDNSLWPFTPPLECPKGQHLENRACVLDNPTSSGGTAPGGVRNILTANAGADQTANEGDKVMLHGSGSDDSAGNSLTYSWKKVKGLSVSLDNNDNKQVTFFAPQVTKDESVIFQLTVSNGKNKVNDRMKVTIRNVDEALPSNNSPTVEASAEPGSVSYSDCKELQTVKLHAKGKDMEGPIPYKWQQTQGDKVTFLGSDDKPDVTFEAPCKEQKLSFSVTVEDTGGATDTNEISVDVFVSLVARSIEPRLPPVDNELIKIPPTVKASSKPESITYTGCPSNDNLQTVRLQAEGKDTDGNIVSYKWEKTDGDQVNIGRNDQSSVLFKAPCKTQTLSFAVTVKDNDGNTAQDHVSVSVTLKPIPVG